MSGRISLTAAWPLVVLCIVPLLAHLPELLGRVDTYPLLFVSSLVLHTHSGILPGSPFLDGDAASTTLFLGHRAAEDWLHGRLPWWNPYVGVGLPLASEMQPAAFFLPFILLLHFRSGVLLIKLAMQMLAGIACFGFLRQLGLKRMAAVLGAVLFQCNGTFAWFSDAPTLPIAFLPLLMLGLERARTRAAADRRGGETLIALAIAFSLLAGHPETALMDGLLALAWGSFRIRGLGRRRGIAFIWKTAAGGLAGLALAAPALIPFLQDLRVSTVGVHGVFQGPALQPGHLAALLFPNIYGPPWADTDMSFWINSGGYVGAATVFLAVLSLFQRRTSPHTLGGARWLLVIWIVVWLGLSVGVPGLTGAMYLIPGLKEIWVSRYCMASVEFAFCVLASFALDADARAPGETPLLGPLALLGAAGGLALLLDYHLVSAISRGGGSGGWFLAISVLWGAAAVLSLALLIRRPDFPLRRYLIAGIVCADAIGLFVPTTLTGLTNSEMFDAPIAYLRANLHLQRAVSVDNSLPENIGALLGFGSLQYIYLPVPMIWGTFVQQKLDPAAFPTSFPGLFEPTQSVVTAILGHRTTLEALAVRYVVAPSSMNMFSKQTDSQHPVRVFREGGEDIFELPGAAPYADTLGGTCQLTVIDREHMHATCNAPAILIRRELMFPGWTARVNGNRADIATGMDLLKLIRGEVIARARAAAINGHPAAIVTGKYFAGRDLLLGANGEIFQGVALPAGDSDIVWRYAPLHASAIALIFIAGLLALVVFIVRSEPERESPDESHLPMPPN